MRLVLNEMKRKKAENYFLKQITSCFLQEMSVGEKHGNKPLCIYWSKIKFSGPKSGLPKETVDFFF